MSTKSNGQEKNHCFERKTVKSEILKNGSMGIFKWVTDSDTLQVNFEDVGSVSIK